MSRANGPVYPFTAIVGQEPLKTALLVNAVYPGVGGVLIRGQKGTAKSTAVRALAAVLPPMDVVEGCRFSCDPYRPEKWCPECRIRAKTGTLPHESRRPRVVDLPLSTTEDRLVGTIDLEHALKKGERRFEAGLLAEANRGVLYVDEVNLLDDHLVDTLLDVAAMGVNTVQREGISFSHPSRFILVGTMNPEEGDVRPQLLDRFGLCVEVEGIPDPARRVEIVRRRNAYESDPIGFVAAWQDEEQRLEERIRTAQELLPEVTLTDEMLLQIATVCSELGVDGHRADLTMARAATALAALDGLTEVSPEHIQTVAPMVLSHRMRRKPFEQMTFDQAIVEKVLARPTASDEPPEETPRHPETSSGAGSAGSGVEEPQSATAAQMCREDQTVDVAEADVGLRDSFQRDKNAASGRRTPVRSTDRRGRYTRTEPLRSDALPDVDIVATVRTAAVKQGGRRSDTQDEVAVEIRAEDLQNKVRKRKRGASIVFCVDASGSMGATSRMQAAKTAILDLLVDAYQRRDRVGLVSFRGTSAEVVLPPTASVELAQLKLESLPTGGSTPLADGLRRSLEVLDAERRRDPDTVPWLVLVTDGRANVGLDGGLGSEDARVWAQKVKDASVNVLIVDTDSGDSPVTVARDLARITGGDYVRLSTPTGNNVSRVVRDRLLSDARTNA